MKNLTGLNGQKECIVSFKVAYKTADPSSIFLCHPHPRNPKNDVTEAAAELKFHVGACKKMAGDRSTLCIGGLVPPKRCRLRSQHLTT